MVSTYPELKNASNYCRNSGGAGKRPWCFTNDKNKRWEYCHIGADCLKGKKKYSKNKSCKNNAASSSNSLILINTLLYNYSVCLSIVNGGYGNWTLSKKCNSTCGQGIEVWKRYCDTPAPIYDGKNCSLLGSAVEIRNCSNLPPCPSK